jgi:transcriptional regulator with XRE-family HTH domain
MESTPPIFQLSTPFVNFFTYPLADLRPLDLPCQCYMRKHPKQKPRAVVARAFGKAMEHARGGLSMGQVQAYAGISQSTLSHWENGTVAAPDPVLLAKIANLYGVSFVELVNVLRWSRDNPSAEEAPSVVPEATGMRVTGAEEGLVRTFRKLGPEHSSQVWEYIEFLQGRAGGAAVTDAATFRKRKREGGQ